MNTGLIILNYHDIKTNSGNTINNIYTISAEKLEEQLKAILTKFHPEEISLEKIGSIKTNKLLLTFDDGYSSHFHFVKPILDNLGIKAIFFPIFSLLDSPGYLTTKEVIQLQKEGHLIGSHGLNHISLTLYKGQSLEKEINDTLQSYYHITGTDCNYFSLPFGEYNADVLRFLKSKNIEHIFTTNGYPNENGVHFLLNRINIKNQITNEQFLRIIQQNKFTQRVLELKGSANKIRKTLFSQLNSKNIS